MEKHTPTPWKRSVVITSCGKCYKVGTNNMVNSHHGAICLYDDATTLNPHSDGVQEANAEFIVRACNSHQKLVDACKTAHKALVALRSYCVPNSNPTQWCCDVADELKAALAKAEKAV